MPTGPLAPLLGSQTDGANQQICGRPLTTLKADNTRHVWGPDCSRAMNQHLIRHSLTLRSCETQEMGELKRALHLVRDDGSRWSAEFDRIMVPRVANALKARYRALGKHGVWRVDEVTGEVVYADWGKGFLRPEWDGVSFKRADAERLLLLGGGQDGGGVEIGEGRCDEDDDHETIRPEDSVSNIFLLTPPPTPRRQRHAHRPRLPAVAEEEYEDEGALENPLEGLSFGIIRELILEAAGNLFDFKRYIDSLDHGVEHGGAEARAAAEALRDRCLEELEVLEGALDRAAVRDMGIRDAVGVRSPPMGAIWGQLLGGGGAGR